jgi:hypothetical protein
MPSILQKPNSYTAVLFRYHFFRFGPIAAILPDGVMETNTTELEPKNLQIMEMDQMRTHFYTNVSHEFRIAHKLIIDALEDIMTKKDLTEKNREAMERMPRMDVVELRKMLPRSMRRYPLRVCQSLITFGLHTR